MTSIRQLLSPRDLADAVGVGESSIKRWADSGQIQITRTSGGHRRIQLKEAIRFIREAGLEVVKHTHLGLSIPSERDLSDASLEMLLKEALLEGDQERATQLVQALYLEGCSVGTICDGPFSSALVHTGQLWRENAEDGILIEHRCTAISISALEQLRSLGALSTANAPTAIGGALSGDQSQLPSLMATAALEAHGFRAVNLGGNTPAATFEAGIKAHSPALVWISINHIESVDLAQKSIQEIAEYSRERGIQVIVGGRGCDGLNIKSASNLFLARSMSDLESFTRGMLATKPTQ
jgi:methanogenic corrinoid protein MtbC1